MIHLGTVKLETKRLILRRIRKEDALEIFNGLRNQKEFLYYSNKQRVNLQQQIKSLEDIDEKYLDLTYYNWVITEKESKKIVGMVNLKIFDRNDSVEFNYAIDNRYTCNGYMTETLKEIINFALNRLKANRIQGGCCVENLASKKVMEKCGMNFEGTLKKYIKLEDGYHDMYLFSIPN